ncbi:mersacidin family lantibiotic [Paenibacillus thiaminolyticus]|uniref:mersacidin family lantibiotic n=1 Tax=Paenibacillus thiaminolyticus TaxID=49283 RepID=UPI003D27ABC9
MTREEIKLMNQSCGNGLKSLSMEEMQNIYGASDVDPRGTPATVLTSSKICLSIVGTIASGVITKA